MTRYIICCNYFIAHIINKHPGMHGVGFEFFRKTWRYFFTRLKSCSWDENELLIQLLQLSHDGFQGRSLVDVVDIDVSDLPFFVDDENRPFCCSAGT